jgi:hypothetical protein
VPAGGGRWLSFFFDGTGNNLDADLPNGSKLDEREHRNVARLYRVHAATDAKQGVYRFYIPGVGTYFRDINDEGNTVAGRAGGEGGEERLEWAMKAFDRAIAGSKDKINVSLFGFSRGAALARAFARRIADRCMISKGQWYLRSGMRPNNPWSGAASTWWPPMRFATPFPWTACSTARATPPTARRSSTRASTRTWGAAIGRERVLAASLREGSSATSPCGTCMPRHSSTACPSRRTSRPWR